LPADVAYTTLFEDTFARYLTRFDLVAVETVQAGTLTELMYDIALKKHIKTQEFLEELRKLNHNNKVVLITSYQGVDL
jgi:archaellum biogenesis ATPase FlaH